MDFSFAATLGNLRAGLLRDVDTQRLIQEGGAQHQRRTSGSE